MAFLTKVITDTSPDFGDNPQTVTENDRPASVEVDGLVANTGYWTKAEIWQNGVLNDTSEVETFTTLPAGTITLEHISTTRSGYGYDVAYRYTSTYAPSSAILSTNGTQFQGFIDSAQHAVSFWVTGLTAGTAYLTNVTLYDIYGESTTVMGSIVATVVNEVRITGTSPHETSVDCELDYVIDEGFTTGWVDYWLGTDDPTQTQPQGHFYFNDGDETCTVSGLTVSTSYKFRATIVLGDGTTEVVSNVVTATTVVDYSAKYFRIDNRGTSQTTLYMKSYSSGGYDCPNWNNCYSAPNALYYGGTSWHSENLNASSVTITNISAGYGTYFKHTGRMGGSYFSGRGTVIPFWFSTTGNNTFSASGNLNSLANGDDFQTVFKTYTYQWAQLFYGWTALTNVNKLRVGVTTIPQYGMYCMFKGCTNLAKGLDLSRVSRVGEHGMESMYEGCTSLTEVYAPNVSDWNTGYFYNWLKDVAANGVIYKPAALTIPTDSDSGVPRGWTTRDY